MSYQMNDYYSPLPPAASDETGPTPVPGWGMSPLRAGPPMVGVGASSNPYDTPAMQVYMAVATVVGAACVYHGYKRTGSVGWAIGWGFFGSMLPIIALPIALAEGYGKPAKV